MENGNWRTIFAWAWRNNPEVLERNGLLGGALGPLYSFPHRERIIMGRHPNCCYKVIAYPKTMG